jgi:hypothetical protein
MKLEQHTAWDMQVQNLGFFPQGAYRRLADNRHINDAKIKLATKVSFEYTTTVE